MFVHRAAGDVHRVCLFTECVCSQSCWRCSHSVFVHRAAGDVHTVCLFTWCVCSQSVFVHRAAGDVCGAGIHQAAVQEPPGGGGAQRLPVAAQARHPAHQAHRRDSGQPARAARRDDHWSVGHRSLVVLLVLAVSELVVEM